MRSLAAVLIAMGLALSTSAAEITKETITSGGQARTYHLFAPSPGSEPAPLLILLHGSGRNGKVLLDHWRSFAAKQGIVLAGPEAIEPEHWQFPADGPVFLRDVVDDVMKRTAIDRRRVYLFGHSAGANFAVPMALLQSTYFAAAVAHAGGIANGNEEAINLATRKVPVSLIVGVRDHALANARMSHRLMTNHGLHVELVEIPKHGHDYYRLSKLINEMAWKFLSAHSLEKDAAWISYANIPE